MIFQFVQKNMEILGISRTQPIYIFYGKALIGHIVLCVAVFWHFKFLFRGNLTFEEYMQSLFMTTITVMSYLCYTCIISQNKKVFEIIDMIEATIELFSESESKFGFDFIFACEYELQKTNKHAKSRICPIV